VRYLGDAVGKAGFPAPHPHHALGTTEHLCSLLLCVLRNTDLVSHRAVRRLHTLSPCV